MNFSLGCVVEGHGDVEAVPVLLRRVLSEMDASLSPRIARPIRTPRYKLVKEEEIERAVTLAAAAAGNPCAVLVLVDAEDDCPATLAPRLLERARARLKHIPVAVVVVKFEFEAWFLAAAESLRGNRGLKRDLESPSDPEGVRGAKEWLERHMEEGRRYSETIDQAPLAAQMDLSLARRRSSSFDKLWRELDRLLREVSSLPSSSAEPTGDRRPETPPRPTRR